MGAFQIADPFPGASVRIRRVMGSIDVTEGTVLRVLSSVAKIHVEHSCPGWRGEAWGHIIFPKQKVAIGVFKDTAAVRLGPWRQAWEKQGWKGAAVTRAAVRNMSDDKLVADLCELLGVKIR